MGDPINFKGIVYAPMNEAGVILLFSKIMDDLGIFYESSPSKGIDMVGRRRTEKGLKRVFIEFDITARILLLISTTPDYVTYLCAGNMTGRNALSRKS